MHSLMQTSTAEDHNLPAWQQRARELATQAGQTMPTVVWGTQLGYDRRRDEIAVARPATCYHRWSEGARRAGLGHELGHRHRGYNKAERVTARRHEPSVRVALAGTAFLAAGLIVAVWFLIPSTPTAFAISVGVVIAALAGYSSFADAPLIHEFQENEYFADDYGADLVGVDSTLECLGYLGFPFQRLCSRLPVFQRHPLTRDRINRQRQRAAEPRAL